MEIIYSATDPVAKATTRLQGPNVQDTRPEQPLTQEPVEELVLSSPPPPAGNHRAKCNTRRMEIKRPRVGKVDGDCIYVHKSAIERASVPLDVLESRAEHLPSDFDYQVIKYDRRSGAVSFIQSPDWDKSSEPLVGDSYKVDADGDLKFRRHNPENPQIYHHKYQFVDPDYEGFNVAESRQHAQQWEGLKPDKSRIGYKKYWDKEVVPKLQTVTGYSEGEMEIANKTARNLGAVGSKALVPRVVAETSKKSERILDFGSGPAAAHSEHLRQQGFRHVVAHEFGDNIRPGVHNPKALQMEYDTVFASNVLNVQSNEEMLKRTLDQLAGVVKSDGRLVANLPESPRKMNIDAKTLTRMLSQRFEHVERVAGTSGAPVLEARYPKQKYALTPNS